ncbi:hypothetical protein Taro_048023 [Colocasia esculenta]|uniref:Uncharacterized protein n=1 Tax=Colocasia esculenta TaxID=4460 RepID=A0A843X235_COLES|nr:hypothetical protein [Colocasia esculenta]
MIKECRGGRNTTLGISKVAKSTWMEPGQTFSYKDSVDTTINGVDTMAQSKGRNVKKRSTSVDTSPGQVDNRDLSQGLDLSVWDSVSTHLMGRSTHSGISMT